MFTEINVYERWNTNGIRISCTATDFISICGDLYKFFETLIEGFWPILHKDWVLLYSYLREDNSNTTNQLSLTF